MIEHSAIKNYWLKIFAVIFFSVSEIFLLYYTPRANFIATYSLTLLLFAGYFFIIKKEKVFDFRFCIALAILLRCVAFFNVPVLSDDYFRFIWDGKMALLHINPFEFTPQDYLKAHNTTADLMHLFNSMNSQEYHTIYPPVLQFIFMLAAKIGGSNEYRSFLIMKLFIFLAEIGTMRFIFLTAKKIKLNDRDILWYILNPLIIIELTGNVHFEAIMIFFFIAFFYYLSDKKNVVAALFFGLAVCTKLIPLIIAPLIWRFLGFKKFVSFMAISGVIIIGLFLPFFNIDLIKDVSSSLRLFFHLFEFNAGVFYFIRWIGFHYVDYDIIEETAPVLGYISFITIVAISWWPAKKFYFAEKCLWVFCIYFLFSTMMHPWYTAMLILLSALTKWKFPLVFSLLIFISYYPYSLSIYEENMQAVCIEYALLFGFIIWEVWHRNKKVLVALK